MPLKQRIVCQLRSCILVRRKGSRVLNIYAGQVIVRYYVGCRTKPLLPVRRSLHLGTTTTTQKPRVGTLQTPISCTCSGVVPAPKNHHVDSPGFARDAGHFSTADKTHIETQAFPPTACTARHRDVYPATPSQCNIRTSYSG
jgi:hypothetical protein